MAKFQANVLVEGWVRVDIEAPSQQAACAALRCARVRFSLVDGALTTIATVADSPGGEASMFTVDIEDITPRGYDELKGYYSV